MRPSYLLPNGGGRGNPGEQFYFLTGFQRLRLGRENRFQRLEVLFLQLDIGGHRNRAEPVMAVREFGRFAQTRENVGLPARDLLDSSVVHSDPLQQFPLDAPLYQPNGDFGLLLARFIPIIAPLAIAGALGGKRAVAETGGTFRTDTVTFGVILLAVILIVGALLFFPLAVLGPVAEHLTTTI